MKETYKVPGSPYNVIVCESFNEILKKSTIYDPLRFSKDKVEKAIGKVVKAGMIDLSIWNMMVATWKRYSIILTYGYYDPYEDIIFINLPSLGIKVSKQCDIYTVPTPAIYKRLSKLIAHELIHYVFQNNITSIYSYIRKKIITFYRTFWANIFEQGAASQVAETNFVLGLDMNVNLLDKDIALLAQKNMYRFISILEKFTESYYVKDKQLLHETINTIKGLMQGRYSGLSQKLNNAFIQAYVSIYDSYPRDIGFGQELIYSSEILSVAADIESTSSKLTVRRILTALEV